MNLMELELVKNTMMKLSSGFNGTAIKIILI